MATAGVEAYQADDYKVAVDKLERAYEILRVPSIGLWLARALAKQGKLVAASERYVEVGRLSVTGGDTAVQESAKKDAASELDTLSPQIPSVVIRLDGAQPADVTLKLDGAVVSAAVVGEQQPVDPGKHHVEGQRGSQMVSADVTTAKSESKTVTLRFTTLAIAAGSQALPDATATTVPPATAATPSDSAPSSPPGSARKILGWSVIGVGAAGVVTGVVAGSVALSKKGKLDDNPDCVDRVCLRSTTQGDLDSYAAMRTISSVGFIAGGVLAAAGVVLLVTAPSADSSSAQRALWLRVGANGVQAGGQF